MSTQAAFVYYAATAIRASGAMGTARTVEEESCLDWVPWQRLYAEGLEVWGAEMWWSDFDSRRVEYEVSAN